MSTRFEPCIADGVKFADYSNVAVTVWAQKTLGVTGALAKLDELMNHVTSQHPEGAVLIVVITQGNQIPNSQVRKELEAFYTRWLKSWRAVVFVAEGNDLWSVTARSVMTALRLVQQKPYPTKIFSETKDGAKWAAEFATKPQGKTPEDVERDLLVAIEDLRRMAL
jgi:hypothetical protein